jgi:formylglycine-generating enzyme required for sulfatase activity
VVIVLMALAAGSCVRNLEADLNGASCRIPLNQQICAPELPAGTVLERDCQLYLGQRAAAPLAYGDHWSRRAAAGAASSSALAPCGPGETPLRIDDPDGAVPEQTQPRALVCNTGGTCPPSSSDSRGEVQTCGPSAAGLNVDLGPATSAASLARAQVTASDGSSEERIAAVWRCQIDDSGACTEASTSAATRSALTWRILASDGTTVSQAPPPPPAGSPPSFGPRPASAVVDPLIWTAPRFYPDGAMEFLALAGSPVGLLRITVEPDGQKSGVQGLCPELGDHVSGIDLAIDERSNAWAAVTVDCGRGTASGCEGSGPLLVPLSPRDVVQIPGQRCDLDRYPEVLPSATASVPWLDLAEFTQTLSAPVPGSTLSQLRYVVATIIERDAGASGVVARVYNQAMGAPPMPGGPPSMSPVMFVQAPETFRILGGTTDTLTTQSSFPEPATADLGGTGGAVVVWADSTAGVIAWSVSLDYDQRDPGNGLRTDESLLVAGSGGNANGPLPWDPRRPRRPSVASAGGSTSAYGVCYTGNLGPTVLSVVDAQVSRSVLAVGDGACAITAPPSVARPDEGYAVVYGDGDSLRWASVIPRPGATLSTAAARVISGIVTTPGSTGLTVAGQPRFSSAGDLQIVPRDDGQGYLVLISGDDGRYALFRIGLFPTQPGPLATEDGIILPAMMPGRRPRLRRRATGVHGPDLVGQTEIAYVAPDGTAHLYSPAVEGSAADVTLPVEGCVTALATFGPGEMAYAGPFRDASGHRPACAPDGSAPGDAGTAAWLTLAETTPVVRRLSSRHTARAGAPTLRFVGADAVIGVVTDPASPLSTAVVLSRSADVEQAPAALARWSVPALTSVAPGDAPGFDQALVTSATNLSFLATGSSAAPGAILPGFTPGARPGEGDLIDLGGGVQVGSYCVPTGAGAERFAIPLDGQGQALGPIASTGVQSTTPLGCPASSLVSGQSGKLLAARLDSGHARIAELGCAPGPLDAAATPGSRALGSQAPPGVCQTATDCDTGFCHPVTGRCARPSCSDGFKNGGETDVDCGGSCPAACPDGKSCRTGADCQGGFCASPSATLGYCMTSSCTDFFRDGDESDVDCGGSCPDRCGEGQGCRADSDCQAGSRCDGLTQTCTECPAEMVPLPGDQSRCVPGSNPQTCAGQPFCIDQTEVTVHDYVNGRVGGMPGDLTGVECTQVSEAPGIGHPGLANVQGGAIVAGRELHPMNCVSFDQAQAYCTAQGKRLLTEVEWEYAALSAATPSTPPVPTGGHPWGDTIPTAADTVELLCWSGGPTGQRQTTCPVGMFSPQGDSAQGVQDLGGNVYEWTSTVDASGSVLVHGGGWSTSDELKLNALASVAHPPTDRFADLGFRCARSITAAPRPGGGHTP